MISFEYSSPFTDILALVINISGGDVMNIISGIKGNVAGRGVRGACSICNFTSWKRKC